MKRSHYIVTLALSGVLLSSCVSVKMNTQANIEATTDSSAHLMQAVLWQQNAAEYRALCYQAYNTAKWRLQQLLAETGATTEKLAIVTDIDETVLDNSPFEAKLIQTKDTYSETEWANWVNRQEAEAVPGAVGFLNYAQSQGVEVFYVSNRSEAAEKATIANLKSLGFPYADEAHLLLKTDDSAKKSRFNEVAEQHKILLFIGDNLSDFTSKFRVPSTQKRNALADQLQDDFGKKFIVLPNPMYGDWETKGLFKGRYDWTETQKDSIRKANLKAY